MILVVLFLKYVIFCVYPWDLLWYVFFFVFKDIMWLVQSSWCVHCCSIHLVSWVSDRCEANLRCGGFCPKKLSSHYGHFFFLVLNTRLSLSFHKFERQRCLFGVDNAFFNCYWDCFFLFQFFFLWNHVILCVYQWCGFSQYQWFHIWSQCLADIIISMCSFLFIYSVQLG